MVRVGGVVACIHLSKVAAELGNIEPHDLQHTSLFDKVEEEQGQRVTLGGLSKGKDVKLPAVLCGLQTRHQQCRASKQGHSQHAVGVLCKAA